MIENYEKDRCAPYFCSPAVNFDIGYEINISVHMEQHNVVFQCNGATEKARSKMHGYMENAGYPSASVTVNKTALCLMHAVWLIYAGCPVGHMSCYAHF